MRLLTKCYISILLAAIALYAGAGSEIQAATFTVTNLSDSGAGSLRAAIAAANSSSGADTINFTVAGTINVLSQLPTLSDTTGGTLIDGTTAPGYSGTPVVILRGPGTGSFRGIQITSANNEVRALQIDTFAIGVEILNVNATGNAVTASYIGTDGTTAIPNQVGTLMDDAPNNRTGTDGDGNNDANEGNVISGNNTNGVRIIGSLASGNVVAGNLIGLDAAGTTAVPNAGQAGVQIILADNNRIGTNGDGVSDVAERNVVSGNTDAGLFFGSQSNGNVIAGNYIGTDVTGTAAVANVSSASAPFKAGIFISGSNNRIGTDGNGTADSAERNVISGNNLNSARGIEFNSGSNNIVAGNFIGVDSSGLVALGNAGLGVYVPNASGTRIGTDGSGANDAAERNIISANGSQGVLIQNTSTAGTIVAGNFIGTDSSGTVDLGNTYEGIQVNNASNTRIGTDGNGVSDVEERNIISGNGNNGVSIFSSSATDNVVAGNYIGTDVSGTVALGNSVNGVTISSAPNNRIGGTLTAERNIISGNNRDGVEISSSFATGNLVQGNFIGTDATGTAAVPNSFHGVEIRSNAPNNTIGGAVVGAGNVISGNGDRGISIAFGSPTAGNNFVQGNIIGLDAGGTAALGNADSGVYINSSTGNEIGGASTAARNVISANGFDGVEILGSSSTLVRGNYIGTDATGTLDRGNIRDGVNIVGTGINNIVVGGTLPGEGNLISGNDEDGVDLSNGSDTLVQGNLIGTDASGTLPLGNVRNGVGISSNSNTIGGTVSNAGNVIAHNGWDGVAVNTGTNNSILSNNIFANADLGIDLSPSGVTSNDLGDGDAGANGLQNFPVIISATSDGSSTTMVGSLNSTPDTSFTLQFFSNSACDSSDFGEGETFLGSASVTTDNSGNVNFAITLPTPAPLTDFITATATDPTNNTSEFSSCDVQVDSPEADLTVSKSDGDVTVTEGDNIYYTISVSNDGPDTAKNVILTDNLPTGGTFVSATAIPGSCVENNGTVTCSLGDIAGGGALVFITVNTTSPGTLTNSANVSSDTDETNLANNTASETTTVNALNNPPDIAPDQATVTVNEGQTATNTGTVSDPDGDTVTLTASAGTVINNNDGTWSWNFPTSDGPAESQTVTITADDDDIDTTDTTFELTVDNVAPTATFANTSGTVIAGGTAALEFSDQFDPGGADITAGFQYSFDCTNDGAFEVTDGIASSFACPYGSAGTFTAKGRIKDKDGGFTDYTVEIIVDPLNQPPSIAADNSTVTVDESQTATNTGTVSDLDGDSVTLTASVGTVINNNDGTWSWNFPTSDGPAESQTVTITADDGTDITNASFDLTVANVAPTATFANTSGTVIAGGTATLEFSNQFDPSEPDTTAGFQYSFDCTNDGTFEATDNPAASFSCSYPSASSFTALGRIKDKDGDFTDYTVEVVVIQPNQAPQVTVNNSTVTVDEGQTAANTGTVSDPDGDTVTLTASVGTVINNNDGTWSWSFDTSDGPAESQTVTIFADDNNGGTSQASFNLTVVNVAPTVDAISVPVDPIALEDQPVSASASFSDPADTLDAHNCTIDYGDGSEPQTGTISGLTCTGPDHTYADPGVYVVTVTVTDKDGGTDIATATDFIVIYDPDGGFVTGGGWIDSPPDAYTADLALTGKANFGFVSKYKKGANVPTGQTEFHFKAGDLNFHSDDYEWLVVAGPHAKFKGTGTINGAGNYGFMVTATDSDINGGGDDDGFRIKIWDKDDGDTIVYDNKPGESDDSNDTTALGGGNIKIHKAK